MNDDFENKLMRDIAATPRQDATRAWKAEIVARALQASTPPKRTLPPRWLLVSWAAAWAAVCALHFTEPADKTPHRAENLASTKPAPARGAALDSSAFTLFAFHQNFNLNLEQP